MMVDVMNWHINSIIRIRKEEGPGPFWYDSPHIQRKQKY
jgi:hypothetical protein